MIPKDWLARARSTLADLIDRSREVSSSNAVFTISRTRIAPKIRSVRRIKDPHINGAIYGEMLTTPRILDLVVQLIGPNLRMDHSKLNIKPARGGEPVEWHQDWAFYPHSNDDILEVGVMIEDCTLENGPMLMMPGSHRGPVYDHHFQGYFAGRDGPRRRRDSISPRRFRSPGEAGTISLHHVRTVHGSRDNLSDRDRPLLLFGYRAADAWPLRSDWFKDLESFNAMMVRGEPTLQPRLRDVPVRMPYPPSPHQGSIFENQRLVKGRSFAMAM